MPASGRARSLAAGAPVKSNRYPDREPYVFDFTYVLKGKAIIQTTSARSDGTWARYTFDDHSYRTSETLGGAPADTAVFTFERDAATHAVTALTLTCPIVAESRYAIRALSVLDMKTGSSTT